MFLIVLLMLSAAASASPWYGGRRPNEHDSEYVTYHHGPLVPDVYTARGHFDRMMDLTNKITGTGYHVHCMNQQTCRRVIGNEYRITIPMPGFDADDIVVKTEKRRLVVRAVHAGAGEIGTEYRHIDHLPEYVHENGSWVYKCGLLKMVFPLVRGNRHRTTPTPTPTPTTTTTTTPSYDTDTERGDADDDVRGDVDSSYTSRDAREPAAAHGGTESEGETPPREY